MSEGAEAAPDEATLAKGIRSLVESQLCSASGIEIDEPRRTFGGNARSAWTTAVRWEDNGSKHDTELILLVRSGGSQVQVDPRREVAVLEALAGSPTARAPRIWGHDVDGLVFGGAATLLERLPGSADPVAFLGADSAVGRARTLDMARVLAAVHAARLPNLVDQEPPLIPHWRSQFEEVRREPEPTLSWLFDWLEDNETPSEKVTLVHGDFRPGNVLYESERISGVLDWELAHIGDPVEDIAWAYRRLWSPEKFVPIEEFIAEYERAGGISVTADTLRWYRVFVEVKFAVISLRAARSFADGQSRNLRFIDRARTVISSVQRALDFVTESEGASVS